MVMFMAYLDMLIEYWLTPKRFIYSPQLPFIRLHAEH